MDISDRDIQGVTYKVPEGEAALYDGVQSARNKKQSDEILLKLEKEQAEKAKMDKIK